MRFIFAICTFFGFTINFTAQVSRYESEPLKVVWKTEFTAGESALSGLVTHGGNMYVTQTGGSSVFNIVDQSGAITFTSIANNTRIRSLFKYNGFLWSMGDQHLTQRDLNGNIVKEVILPLLENENISSRNGKILKGKVYTTHSHSYFLKYSGAGEQIFKKVVGSSDIHFLEIGGNHIYINSTIYDLNPVSRLMQYDTLGNQNWSIGVNGVKNLFADELGNCYAIVYSSGTSSNLLKFTQAGQLAWNSEIPGQMINSGTISGDHIILAGMTIPTVNEFAGGAISILSLANAEILSQHCYDLYSDGTDEGYGEQFTIVASEGENIYAGGFSGIYPKGFMVKLSREGNTTGINETKGSHSGFNIFPNPGGSKFTISCSEVSTGKLKITVRNTSGQIVQNKNIECNGEKSWELDLGRQAPGNYTVEILSGGQKVVKKVVLE